MFNYSRDLVRRLDYEGFLIANLACKGHPRRHLDAVMAIKAFDAETATISHSVKTPEAAAIRYEFWRIGLRKIKSKESVDGHPVMEDLFRSDLTANQLNLLEESLNSRADSLDRRIYSLADLDEYSQKSIVPILRSIDESIGSSMAKRDHLLEHLGKAQVTIRRLRGLAKALNTSNPLAEQFIPIGLLGPSGLNGPQMIKESSKGDKMKDLVHEMTSHALSHLSLIPRDGANGLFVKLSAYGCQRYLLDLKKQNFDVCNEKVWKIGSQRDGFLPLKLFVKSLF